LGTTEVTTRSPVVAAGRALSLDGGAGSAPRAIVVDFGSGAGLGSGFECTGFDLGSDLSFDGLAGAGTGAGVGVAIGGVIAGSGVVLGVVLAGSAAATACLRAVSSVSS
jgi:hypothetical protein